MTVTLEPLAKSTQKLSVEKKNLHLFPPLENDSINDMIVPRISTGI